MNTRLPIGRRTILGVLFASLWGGTVSAETFTPGDIASLRAALLETSSNGEDDTIDLGGQTFILDEALLIVPEDHLLEIGNGTLERVQGSDPTRLVEVTRDGSTATASSDNQVSFKNISFLNGRVDVGDVASNSTGGGAILADWWVLVEDSRFENNTVVGNGSGGAILSEGKLTVLASDFVNNTALAGNGGAIIVKVASDQITESSFIGNRADRGGALYYSVSSSDISSVAQSFFQGNSATTLGGAVFSAKNDLTLGISTFHDNLAGVGGGAIYSQSKGYELDNSHPFEGFGLHVYYSALIDNTAAGGSGGDGVLAYFSEEKGVVLNSSILGDNGDENCANIGGSAERVALNYKNIADDNTCGTDEVTIISNIRSLFSGELAQNGGRTPTFALATESIAIDASPSSFCSLVDQRGVARERGEAGVGTGQWCDTGPYELDFSEFDIDDDAIPDNVDNCPAVANADQENLDGDRFGDACDTIDNRDQDEDGLENFEDNCPLDPNLAQTDSDLDGLGDACDVTPTGDADGDGIDDADDNCRTDANPDQSDADLDGDGDACDITDNRDTDGDEVQNYLDNCPSIANTGQEDSDGDGDGDACDVTDNRDTDGDEVQNYLDNCPSIANTGQEDSDGDGDGDACDTIDNADTDGDEVENYLDNCPLIANAGQEDSDGNGVGDACDEPVDTGDTDINGQVTQAAETLDDIIAGTSRQTRRILSGAAYRLDQALSSNLWTSGDELSSRRGSRVFSYVGLAVNEIERIADNRHADAGLRSELDAVSALLLDKLRILAENRIADAEAANGRQWRIARANVALGLGDRDRSRDWLKGAAYNYGYAWSWASSAL